MFVKNTVSSKRNTGSSNKCARSLKKILKLQNQHWIFKASTEFLKSTLDLPRQHWIITFEENTWLSRESPERRGKHQSLWRTSPTYAQNHRGVGERDVGGSVATFKRGVCTQIPGCEALPRQFTLHNRSGMFWQNGYFESFDSHLTRLGFDTVSTCPDWSSPT